jgi:hypothetical protein
LVQEIEVTDPRTRALPEWDSTAITRASDLAVLVPRITRALSRIDTEAHLGLSRGAMVRTAVTEEAGIRARLVLMAREKKIHKAWRIISRDLGTPFKGRWIDKVRGIISLVQETISVHHEIIFRAHEMDIKDLGMEDSRHQEIIFLVQARDFLEPGIILGVLGKVSKGLEIIFRAQKTDSQGHRLETSGIQQNPNLGGEGHVISLLHKTSSRKEDRGHPEDPKITDLSTEEVEEAEEGHGGEVALDPRLPREALATSRTGSEAAEEAAADLDQQLMTRGCSSQILAPQHR